ncbi:MAG: CpsB/CapC family capsule biosynthesis tyrosine phosphatase [Eubacteriales bacterium]
MDGSMGVPIIDIHSHILPYLDDGARNMAEAIAMAADAYDGGTRVMVVTPHANQKGRFENYATSQMQDIFEKFQWELVRNQIPLVVLPGMEIYASKDMVSYIRRKRLTPLAGSKVFLVEFSFRTTIKEIEYLLEEMLYAGFQPMIAHPERYTWRGDIIEEVMALKEQGCYIQVNGDSVLGDLGEEARYNANKLLEADLVDVISSDCHSLRFRRGNLEQVQEHLIQEYGNQRAEMLLYNKAKELLQIKI